MKDLQRSFGPAKFLVSSVFLLFLLGFHHQALASTTHISSNIESDTTWALADSPYVIDNYVSILNGSTLTIEPGVVVKFSPYAGIGLNGAGSIIANATLGEKIYFTSITDDSVGGDTNADGSDTVPGNSDQTWGIYLADSLNGNSVHVSFQNVVVHYGYVGLSLCYVSDVVISDSLFEKNYDGIEDCGGSKVSITNSEFKQNNNGINIFQADYEQNSVYNVNNTKIHDNIDFGIYYELHPPFQVNNTSKTIQWLANLFQPKEAFAQAYNYTLNFSKTWWGDASGPKSSSNSLGLGDKVSGNISFSPWCLDDTCTTFSPVETGGSSVLFLPGVKGSVLVKGSADTLWPPTILSVNDIAQLSLDSNGESVNDIHVNGILNNFHGKEIYQPFTDFMNGLVSDGTINNWTPLAYDWRLSPDKIVNDGIKTDSGVVDVVNEIENLAISSKTGKVTIVAHSMGGLLGKAIINKLQEEGKADLIDSFVMVGTPQLGTPQAIGTLLHGDGEDILGGAIVSSAEIRRIAQNMPSAYNLLPSPKYFDLVSDPEIIFNKDSSFTQVWRNLWGLFINKYPPFFSFVAGIGAPRARPDIGDLKNPEVLNPSFLADAALVHEKYDDYQFPNNIRVIQVAGWGVPTMKTIEYKNYHGVPSYEDVFTREGDSTVVYSSAVSSDGVEKYFFNIFDFNDFSNEDIKHRDLLNAQPIQEIIKDALNGGNIIEDSFITIVKPDTGNITDQLVVSAHSPVIIGAYDEFNNFTGIDPNQNFSSGIFDVSEDIPNSHFIYSNEGQYVFLPKNGNYHFKYKGTGAGSTTIEIGNFSGDVQLPIGVFTDIPTTAKTFADFMVNSTNPENTEIKLDPNGDGKIVTLYRDISLEELFSLLKSKILSLNVKDKTKKDLLKKVEELEKKIEKNKKKNSKIIQNLEKKINKDGWKGKIDKADVKVLLELIDRIEDML